MPNSVPGFSDRCNCNEKSVMTAYIVRLFRVIPRTTPRPPSPVRSDRLGAVIGGARDARAAVGSRTRPVRYRSRPLPGRS